MDKFNSILNNTIQKFYKDGKWYQHIDNEYKIEASILDKAYKSPLWTNIQNLIKAVVVNGDYKLLDIVDKTIKYYSGLIDKEPQYYPSALNAIMMRYNGTYAIKGAKIGLLKEQFNDINYPFLYKYAQDSKEYTLCGLRSCFANSINLNVIKKELLKLLNK